jgi:hypothetical protein
MTTLTQRDLWVVREALRRYSTAEPNMASTAQRLAERFNAELHARLDATSIPQQSDAADAVGTSGEPAVLDRVATALDAVVTSQAQVTTALADILAALKPREGNERLAV